MSRQQKRADERRRNKVLHNICLAAGEGVGRAVAFTFALATSNAFAQETEKQEEFTLPAVVVKERGEYYVPQSSLSKLPGPLKDTPQSITVIPEKLMEERGVTSFREALRNVPGIGIQAGEGGGPQGDNLTLRGFNAQNDIFLDGVRDQGNYFRDIFNIESVEVLKGPSSMYFGRGSTGGIINQVSKTPRLDPSYGAAQNLGSGILFRTTADINLPISATSAFRINLMSHRDDIVGRDVVDQKRVGVAPSIAFGLGTPTQITLSHLFQKEDNLPDYGFPFFQGAPAKVDRNNFYGLAKHDYERTWLNASTLRLDHRFNEQFSLRNTSRHSQNHRQATPTRPATTDGVTVTRARTGRDLTQSILSNQTDLTAKFDTLNLKHTLVTGAEVSREVIDRKNFSFGSVPSTNLQNPNPNSDASGMTRTVSGAPFTTALGFGIFAADQIKLNPYFDITEGVRWDYFDTDFDDSGVTPRVNRSRLDKLWSHRAGLVFHPTPAQSYYFSYATAFNPSAEGLALSANNTALPPEKNRTFELGGKVELQGGALLLQGALFRIDKTNARTVNPVDATLQALDGKQRVDGVEFGITGRVLPGWNVFAGYTYLNPKILKSNDVQGGVRIEGKDLQNVPEHSATLWTTYDFLEKWQAGGGPSYVGRRYANNSNTNRVPGYVRWDATLGYTLSKNIQLRLNALNLTNQLYFDSVQASRAIPAPGRSIVFSANFKF